MLPTKGRPRGPGGNGAGRLRRMNLVRSTTATAMRQEESVALILQRLSVLSTTRACLKRYIYEHGLPKGCGVEIAVGLVLHESLFLLFKLHVKAS